MVGYGAQKKASLTSSISQIKGDEAFKNKRVLLMLQSLCKVKFRIDNSHALLLVRVVKGSRDDKKIRGDIISVNGKSSPLVIIDGITGSLDEG